MFPFLFLKIELRLSPGPLSLCPSGHFQFSSIIEIRSRDTTSNSCLLTWYTYIIYFLSLQIIASYILSFCQLSIFTQINTVESMPTPSYLVLEHCFSQSVFWSVGTLFLLFLSISYSIANSEASLPNPTLISHASLRHPIYLDFSIFSFHWTFHTNFSLERRCSEYTQIHWQSSPLWDVRDSW